MPSRRGRLSKSLGQEERRAEIYEGRSFLIGPLQGEQMAVLAAGAGRLYGSKDESNGRVNPALEPDYDMEPGYPAVDQATPGGGGGGGGLGSAAQSGPHHTSTAAVGNRQLQNSTAF